MIQELTSEIKEPRFLNCHPEDYFQSIEAVKVFWPHRVFTKVFELNLSGFVAEKCEDEYLPKFAQRLTLRLMLPGSEETQSFEVRVAKISEKYIYFIFDKNSPQSRLLLDQSAKDQIIVSSLKQIPLNLFQTVDRQSIWLHGAFDTNFVLWQSDLTSKIQEFALEYDNLLMTYKDGRVHVQRTPQAVTVGKSYFPFDASLVNRGPRISLGNGWLPRLIKLLESFQANSPVDLAELIQLLKTNSEH